MGYGDGAGLLSAAGPPTMHCREGRRATHSLVVPQVAGALAEPFPGGRQARLGLRLLRPAASLREATGFEPVARRSHDDLRADLDHAVGRNLEISGRILRTAGEPDEQPFLPQWHA